MQDPNTTSPRAGESGRIFLSSNDAETLARAVRTLRRARRLTQKQLAAAAKVAPNTVGGLERGRDTRSAQVDRICAALGTTIDALLTPPPVGTPAPGISGQWSLEDLAVATEYQRAETDIRLAVRRLLQLGRRDPMFDFWYRLQRLPDAVQATVNEELSLLERKATPDHHTNHTPKAGSR